MSTPTLFMTIGVKGWRGGLLRLLLLIRHAPDDVRIACREKQRTNKSAKNLPRPSLKMSSAFICFTVNLDRSCHRSHFQH